MAVYKAETGKVHMSLGCLGLQKVRKCLEIIEIHQKGTGANSK
jgi:hypothetical protein